MTLNIWFNRWFSTVTHYIEMIRNNPDERHVTIFGTHPNPEAVYLKYCDYQETEPGIKGEAYINYCLNFCKINRIDVFIPRKENVLISQHIAEFEDIGVKVLVCSDDDLMRTLDHKVEMYRSLEQKKSEGKDIISVPAYRVVRSAEQFKEAYEEMKRDNKRLCLKPAVGEGALGFRIIDERADSLSFLLNTNSSNKITFEHVYQILNQVKDFPELMLMEYLSGTEYSIDCLADRNGKLYAAVPRKKGSGRIRELVADERLLQIADQMAAEYKIPFIYNIQVKYQGTEPKLLEINPRMSGGLHFSCLAGVNFPYLAVKLLLGEKVDMPSVEMGVKATYIEQPVIL